jgi:hypothetical protein
MLTWLILIVIIDAVMIWFNSKWFSEEANSGLWKFAWASFAVFWTVYLAFDISRLISFIVGM